MGVHVIESCCQCGKDFGILDTFSIEVAPTGQQFCSKACMAAAQPWLDHEAAVIKAAGDLTRDDIIAMTERIRKSPCPVCRGPGPLDARKFRSMWSFILYSETNKEVILGCRSCITSCGLKSLGKLVVLGWWSPYGLLCTPFFVLMNLWNLLKPVRSAGPASWALEDIAGRWCAEDAVALGEGRGRAPQEGRPPPALPQAKPSAPIVARQDRAPAPLPKPSVVTPEVRPAPPPSRPPAGPTEQRRPTPKVWQGEQVQPGGRSMTCTIGRAPGTSDLLIPAPGVSSAHLRWTWDGHSDSCVVEDTESSNGTWCYPPGTQTPVRLIATVATTVPLGSTLRLGRGVAIRLTIDLLRRVDASKRSGRPLQLVEAGSIMLPDGVRATPFG